MTGKKKPIITVYLLFIALILSMYLPGLQKSIAAPTAMMIACCIILLIISYGIFRGKKPRAAGDIGTIIFALLLFWQFYTTRLGLGHLILVPTPEAVFNIFFVERRLMLAGIGSSLSLLLIGFAIALPLGTVAGLFTGWSKRLAGMFVPIARVLSPVPAIIYAPYLIAIMPSFRSASGAVLVLGIFWPTFLQTVSRVNGFEKALADSARLLNLRWHEMLFGILLPYVLPSTLSGIRITLSMAFMLLVLAEMMGAHSGLGYFIKNFADYANYTNVIAGILLVAIVITLLNKLLDILYRHVLGKYETNGGVND